MNGIPEAADGTVDPIVLSSREQLTISERIEHTNWKVRNDVYEEIKEKIKTLSPEEIASTICLYHSNYTIERSNLFIEYFTQTFFQAHFYLQ